MDLGKIPFKNRKFLFILVRFSAIFVVFWVSVTFLQQIWNCTPHPTANPIPIPIRQSCPILDDTDWTIDFRPKYRTRPDKLLLTVGLSGPNNQLISLREMIFAAVKLNRTVVPDRVFQSLGFSSVPKIRPSNLNFGKKSPFFIKNRNVVEAWSTSIESKFWSNNRYNRNLGNTLILAKKTKNNQLMDLWSKIDIWSKIFIWPEIEIW